VPCSCLDDMLSVESVACTACVARVERGMS
jgi:hypothetical protein